MNFSFTVNPAPGVLILQPKRNGAGPTMAFADELISHPRIGGPLTDTQTALGGIIEGLANRSTDWSDAGFNKEAARLVDDRLRAPFRLTVEATYAARREHEVEWTRLHTPQFAEDSDPAVRAEQRTWWRTLSTPARLDAANADLDMARAAVEGGVAMAALPNDVFARLTRSMGERQLAAAIQRSHEYRVAPSADDPVAGEPDRAAALKVAAARFDRLEGERDLIASVSPLLANVVNAVALMTGEDRQAAYDRLAA